MRTKGLLIVVAVAVVAGGVIAWQMLDDSAQPDKQATSRDAVTSPTPTREQVPDATPTPPPGAVLSEDQAIEIAREPEAMVRIHIPLEQEPTSAVLRAGLVHPVWEVSWSGVFVPRGMPGEYMGSYAAITIDIDAVTGDTGVISYRDRIEWGSRVHR
jgi:hypothetical protein